MLVEWTDLDSCRLLQNVNQQETKEGRAHIKENSEFFCSEHGPWGRSTWKLYVDDDDDNNDDDDDDD
jgi:hypothetical protein